MRPRSILLLEAVLLGGVLFCWSDATSTSTAAPSPSPHPNTTSTGSSVTTSKHCYYQGEDIPISFFDASAQSQDWIAVFDNTTDLSTNTSTTTATRLLWLYTCGSRLCNFPVNTGTLTFGQGLPVEAGSIVFPLPTGKFRTVLGRGSSAPFEIVAVSSDLIVEQDGVVCRASKSTIVDILQENEPTFDTLLDMLNSTNIDDLLNQPGPWTLFAPNNVAFEKLGEDMNNYLVQNPAVLANVLRYHILSGSYNSTALTDGSYDTLNGQQINVLVANYGILVINSHSYVIQADLVATNGFVQEISDVLIPPNISTTQPPAQPEAPSSPPAFHPTTSPVYQTPAPVHPTTTTAPSLIHRPPTLRPTPCPVQPTPTTAPPSVGPVQPTPQPADNGSPSISTDRGCYYVGGDIRISFDYSDPQPLDWIAIYSSNVDLDHLDHTPLWVYTCGTQTCEFVRTSGTIVFGYGSRDESGRTDFPLVAGSYIAVLARNLDEPYMVLAHSTPPFTIINPVAGYSPCLEGPNTILDVLNATTRFSTLLDLIESANLWNDLQQPGPFTMFAPNNLAFEVLGQSYVDFLKSNPSVLVMILKYHVYLGYELSGDLESRNYEMWNGQTAQVNVVVVNSETTAVIVILNQKSYVIQANMVSANGVIHEISAVLLPMGVPDPMYIPTPSPSLVSHPTLSSPPAPQPGPTPPTQLTTPTRNSFLGGGSGGFPNNRRRPNLP